MNENPSPQRPMPLPMPQPAGPPAGGVRDGQDALGRALALCENAPSGNALRMLLADVLTSTLSAVAVATSVETPLTEAPAGTPQEALAVLAGIEQLTARLSALDAVWQVEAERRIRAADEAADRPVPARGRGAAAEIALARRASSAATSMSLASARRLVCQMPGMLGLLASGRVTRAQAGAVALSLEGTAADVVEIVDERLAADPGALAGLGRRRTADAVRAVLARVDPAGSRERADHAARHRRLDLRALPDGMAQVLLTMRALDAVALIEAARLEASSRRARGCPDPVGAIEVDVVLDAVLHAASRDRIDAEDFAELVDDDLAAPTNDVFAAPTEVELAEPADDHLAESADAGSSESPTAGPRPSRRPRRRLDVGVVITDRALLAPDAGEPAHLPGYGMIPAHIVTDTLLGRPPGCGPRAAQEWPGVDADAVTSAVMRRLYTHPTSGELVAMESRARAFPVGLERMIRWRDGTCRMPWCNARVRQIDHAVPHADGGATSFENGQGLCIRCNLLKEYGLWTLAVGRRADAHVTTRASVGAIEDGPARSAEAGTASAGACEVPDPGAPDGEMRAGTCITWRSPHGAIGRSPTPALVSVLGDVTNRPDSPTEGKSDTPG